MAEGRIPLWNDRVGFGYPVLGESQTGALYPTNVLLFGMFSVNTAYNVSQLLHYIATFAAAAWMLRVFGVGRVAALFGAGVYTYAWFPPRICLEWAVLGGPYLPLGLGPDRAFRDHRQSLVSRRTHTGAGQPSARRALQPGVHQLCGVDAVCGLARRRPLVVRRLKAMTRRPLRRRRRLALDLVRHGDRSRLSWRRWPRRSR